MSIVSFTNYEVTPRYDKTPWTIIKIYESATETGTYSLIDTITIDPVDPDPANPEPKSFTTENATLPAGWYKVNFLDASSDVLITDPVYNASPESYEILATLADINGNLDGETVEADANNSSLVQISVNRVVKGYLSRVVDAATMASWTTPETTPDIIREIAAKLIAAQVYFNQISKSSGVIPTNHFSQNMYNQAIALLNQVISGDIYIPNVTETPLESLTNLDFFPIDATDRAFTMGMNL